jgi:GT2 family glycosyltransferase
LLLQLSVIIVNYNVKYFLEQCLCSVIKAVKNIDAEVFVVDNNSTDGSADFFTGKFPQVNFIWNKENGGFAKANNQALAIAKGAYILFLNPDTIVPEDCFEKCIDFFKQHNDAGALGIKMVDGAGKFLKESKRAFPSPLTSLFKLCGLARLFPQSKIFGRYHLGHLPTDKTASVDVLAGAFMMIPKAILNTVGGFDERFFMYGEDVDLSYRIQKAGHKNYYYANSSIIHFKGESTKKGSINYVRLFYNAMVLFVKKHYKGSRAGVFTFLIQLAIWFRAGLTLVGKLLKKMGLPILDAGIILMSFWIIKLLWSHYVRQDVNYSPQMLTIAFPVFTCIFLIAAFFSGLYDSGYKQTQLNRSVFFASLVLMSGYALLPENYRFSRGILVFGIILSFALMSIIRWLFVHWKIIKTDNEDDEHRQTVVVADENGFENVKQLMQHAGMQERVLGRVNNTDGFSPAVLGGLSQLPHLIKMYPVKEVIFCEGGLSFKSIIEWLPVLPKNVRYKFHANYSSGIVGSDSKDISGEYVAPDKKYVIGLPVNRRNKIFTDIVVALFFLAVFPLHFFTQKNPLQFFKNLFSVLFQSKTWVGYAAASKALPALKPGILTTTSLPASMNTLPIESLIVADEWYAAGYSAAADMQKIWRGYKNLWKG